MTAEMTVRTLRLILVLAVIIPATYFISTMGCSFLQAMDIHYSFRCSGAYYFDRVSYANNSYDHYLEFKKNFPKKDLNDLGVKCDGLTRLLNSATKYNLGEDALKLFIREYRDKGCEGWLKTIDDKEHSYNYGYVIIFIRLGGPGISENRQYWIDDSDFNGDKFSDYFEGPFFKQIWQDYYKESMVKDDNNPYPAHLMGLFRVDYDSYELCEYEKDNFCKIKDYFIEEHYEHFYSEGTKVDLEIKPKI